MEEWDDDPENLNEDSEKAELELHRLKKYTKNSCGKPVNSVRIIASNPATTSENLHANTRKAADMAAYLNYKTQKDSNRTRTVESSSRGSESKERAEYTLNSVGECDAKNRAWAVENANARKSSTTSTVKSKHNSGSFLATTTRQLEKPTIYSTKDDDFVQKCRKARVKSDFVAKSERELGLKRGQLVWVYEEVDRHWYQGELTNGVTSSQGIFPKNFVEIIDGSEKISTFRVLEYGNADVLYDFKARSEKELSVLRGQVVILVKKIDEHWWEAKTNSTYSTQKKGWVPDSYLKVDKAPVTSDGIMKIPDQKEKVENSKPSAKKSSTER